MTRIVIAGGPRCGKTTYSATLAGPVRHTDDLIGRLDWSAASAAAADWFDAPGPWVVEGVAAVRALRKWLERHRDGKPADLVVWMATPKVPRTPGQEAMAKGCASIWDGVLPLLKARGVAIELR